MLITFKQAKNDLAQYCGSGKYPDEITVGADINMAQERLCNKPKNWIYLTQVITLCAPNGQITMPREVGKVIKARLNGVFADVQSRWFEFLSNGPGLMESFNNYSCLEPLVDRGFVPTQYDIPEGYPMYLSIVSDRVEDDAAKILIRGLDETGREVYTKATFGEYIPIKGGSQDQMWISENMFSKIMSIEKPITNGYVYISAIIPSSGIRYFLGSIHPDETLPHYRRYFSHEIPCTHCKNADGTYVAPTPHRIDALCRLQYIPAVHDSDILLIQNMGAMKMMLKAMRLEDAEKLDEAQKYEATAERFLNEQTACYENDEGMIDIMPGSFGIGPVENLQ